MLYRCVKLANDDKFVFGAINFVCVPICSIGLNVPNVDIV